MNVWHSAMASPSPVGGVAQSVDRLISGLARHARAQPVVLYGTQQALHVHNGQVPNSAIHAGVPWRRRGYNTRSLDELALRIPPDIVHIHWNFQLQNTFLAKWAQKNGIPYIVHPRGALHPKALRRRSTRKRAYLELFERAVLARSSAVVGNTRGDVEDFYRVIPAYTGETSVIPNAVVGPDDRIPSSRGQKGLENLDQGPECVYMGRWDVKHKGLDRLAALARRMPYSSFSLYTDGKPTTRERIEYSTMEGLPSNATLKPPVYGVEKWRVLRSADAYVQLSRWDSFGNSVAESIVAETPACLSSEMYLARQLSQVGACAVLNAEDVGAAARTLRSVLSDSDRRAELIEAGRPFARSVHEDEVAKRMMDIYEAIV